MPKCVSDHYCILAAKNNDDDKIIGLRILPYTSHYFIVKLKYCWKGREKFNLTNDFIIGYISWCVNGEMMPWHYYIRCIPKLNQNFVQQKILLIMNDRDMTYKLFTPIFKFIYNI